MTARSIIRIGDTTSHGGTVVQGFPSYIVFGRPAAGMGHMVSCPRCKGAFPIVEGVLALGIDNSYVAIEGMKTSCGATLIASQQFAKVEYGTGGNIQASDDATTLANGLTGGAAKQKAPLYESLRQADCDHTNTAIPLADFIVREMKTNPFSIVGRQIHDANSYDLKAYSDAWELAPWYSKLSGRKTYLQALAEQKLWAYTLFADIIGPGRPWDHKPVLKKMLGKDFNNGWQKLGDFDYYYDIWSNIHYGYVGVALGFTAAELVNSAGLAQALLDSYQAAMDKRWPTMQHHPENGPWPGSADDVPDHISIKLGCDLYADAKPHELTTATLLQWVDGVPIPWGTGRNSAKEPHTCNR